MTKNLKDVLTQQANEPNLTNVDVVCSDIQMSGVNELRDSSKACKVVKYPFESSSLCN
jgi:hypothetical protein